MRFLDCEGEDGTLMVAWAGYDHLQLRPGDQRDLRRCPGTPRRPRRPAVVLAARLPHRASPLAEAVAQRGHLEFGVPMGDYFEGFLQGNPVTLGRLSMKSSGGNHPSGHGAAVR